MLKVAILFLIIALIAALFGFGGIIGTASTLAQLLFFICLVIFLATLAMSAFRQNTGTSG